RVCHVEDTYRSEYLTVERTDNSVEFLRYNDNGTPEDESDDYEEYYVRYYRLTDFRFPNISRDASEGEIRVYDAALDLIGTWDIADLECTIHGGCDGLETSRGGVEHGLVLPIPTSLLASRSPCIFLCHIKDGHGCDYRDHANRWALNLNGLRPQTLFIWLDGSDPAGSTHLWNSLILWYDLYRFLTWVTPKPCIAHIEGWGMTQGDTRNMTLGGWTTSFNELSSAQKDLQRQWANRHVTRDIRTVVVQKSDHNTHKRLLDESETVAIAAPYNGGTSKNFARSTPDKPAWIMINPLGIENAGYDLNGNVTNDQLKWACTNVLLHELTHVARNPSMQGHCEAGAQYQAKCVWGPELTWEFFSKMKNKTIRIGSQVQETPWHGRYEINEIRKVLGWVEYP
ncbi:MAG: hypothetical protein K6U00_07585, partial [Armatimonadetes bacterium]|nr:hypothetical protein [Armatimonadota bacterium]